MDQTPSPFSCLPGVVTPVSQALPALSDMWDCPPETEGERAPSEFRASQMNFVLHFGPETSGADAAKAFGEVLRFSNRYPCRIVALCPQTERGNALEPMDCKIYSECYIGPSQDGMSCCEAIILGYAPNSRQYLENQVSVYLESDLPTYYWPNRFGAAEPLASYPFFFKEASRVVVDSAIDATLFEQLRDQGIEKFRDLAYSRLLPIRQCLGQFASSSPSANLVEGLSAASVVCCEPIQAEGRALLEWVASAVKRSLLQSGLDEAGVSFDLQLKSRDCEQMSVEFSYKNDHRFRCQIDLDRKEAKLEANVGAGEHVMSAAVYLLETEGALAEALFFD